MSDKAKSKMSKKQEWAIIAMLLVCIAGAVAWVVTACSKEILDTLCEHNILHCEFDAKGDEHYIIHSPTRWFGHK